MERSLILLLLLAACATAPATVTEHAAPPATYDAYTVQHSLVVAPNGTPVADLGMIIFDYDERGALGRVQSALGILGWNGTPVLETEYRVHHDASFTADGSILFLSHEIHPYRGVNVSFDSILLISGDGEPLSTWSSFDHLDELRAIHGPGVLDQGEAPLVPGKYFHFNGVRELPPNDADGDERFRAGNWVVSDRTFDHVFIIDPRTGAIVWSLDNGTGVRKQHAPRVLPDGTLIVLDNGEEERNASRVVQIDLRSGEVLRTYAADGFFTRVGGGVEPVPEGWLVTDRQHGRSFVVDPQDRVLWEWRVPTPESQRKGWALRMTPEFFEEHVRPVLENAPQP